MTLPRENGLTLEVMLQLLSRSPRNKTLGQLVGMFTGENLTAASAAVDVEPEDYASAGGQSADVAWDSMRFNISISPERHRQTKAGLTELVCSSP